MKDPRHTKRVHIVENLFARSFHRDNSLRIHYPHQDGGIAEAIATTHEEDINAYITRFAPRYPIDKIARLDKAILQLAVYELLIAPEKQPPKVVINEAVEIAKSLGNERSFAFVNAVLGAILNHVQSQSINHESVIQSDNS